MPSKYRQVQLVCCLVIDPLSLAIMAIALHRAIGVISETKFTQIKIWMMAVHWTMVFISITIALSNNVSMILVLTISNVRLALTMNIACEMASYTFRSIAGLFM